MKNQQSPGDVVMLTAAVRDLHRQYPDQYQTDVRTYCPALWENNPLITSLQNDDPSIEVIDCDYPLIHSSNGIPHHFIFGFIEFLNERLGLQIRPTLGKGDIHLSAQEKGWMSQVHELTGEDTPFWIVAAGGKWDYTIKWWDVKRYQQVVDHFQGRIQFVQVGEAGHYHPKLDGVIDLRGKTDLRQLVRLVYHAQGVLCPVTALMHLAAAVPMKPGRPQNRPCVVVAGGREPAQWEAYPHHQYIHTNGALWCCDYGGCWKARTEPIGDGDEKDSEHNLCRDTVARKDGRRRERSMGSEEAMAVESRPAPKRLPRCMDMISAVEVIRRIELYYCGGALTYLAGKTPSASVEQRPPPRRAEKSAVKMPEEVLAAV